MLSVKVDYSCWVRPISLPLRYSKLLFRFCLAFGFERRLNEVKINSLLDHPSLFSCTLIASDVYCRFAKSDKAILEDFNKAEAFGKLLKAAGEVAEQNAEMPAADVTAMYIALAQFTASVYPDRLDFVDLVLTSCYQVRE